MTVEIIPPKAPVISIFIFFTCLPSCINLSNLIYSMFLVSKYAAPVFKLFEIILNQRDLFKR